jgi:integrase
MGLYKRGDVYWLNCTIDGRRYQVSTGCDKKEPAEKWEAGWRNQVALGKVDMADRAHHPIGELLDRLQARWEVEGKCSRQNLSLLKKTREDWGTKWAHELTDTDLDKYAARRKRAGYKLATSNRVAQCLRRSFALAKIPWPEYELPKEKGNRRTGFFAPEQVAKLLKELPQDGLQHFTEWCWRTGMRCGEAQALRWEWVHEIRRDGNKNLVGGQLVVPSEFCKNDEPHIIPIAGSLVTILRRREESRAIKNGVTRLSDFIFHRGDGLAIGDFKKSWKTACANAGCGNMLFHDLRRSFARAAILAGIPSSIILALGGWNTPSMLKRYGILVTEDMAQGLEKLEKTVNG